MEPRDKTNRTTTDQEDGRMLREIIVIDEEKCDGCGDCVPACAEGAIQVIDGKARLVSETYCDGLGACLGHCPQDAIRMETREAPEFDEEAVRAHLASKMAKKARPAQPAAPPVAHHGPAGGCPSSRFARFERPTTENSSPTTPGCDGTTDRHSELTHWPIQLRLLPPVAPVLRGAHLLVAADCVPFAYADFHEKLLKGKPVVIACPKLDDPEGYLEKMTEMFRSCGLQGVTVAHMEVPCCMGILALVLEARRQSGTDVPVTSVVVGTQGEILDRRDIPCEVEAR